MKFTTFSLLALGLSSSVLASPTRTARKVTLVERDLATMTSIIADVSSKVDDLQSAIDAYKGGDVSSIGAASEGVIEATKEGAQKASQSSDLTLTDAVGLAKPVQDLTDKVQSSIDDLDGKSDLVVAAGAAGAVLASLKAQKAAAEQLADAITSKVPASSQELAKQLSAGIANAIQKGIDHYTPLVGTGGSSTTAGPTTTAGGSSTAGPTATGGAGSSSAAPTTSAGTQPTSSTGVIPTGSSSSPGPSGSSPAGSGSSSGNPPVSTGAAAKSHISYGLGAIVAIAAFAL